MALTTVCFPLYMATQKTNKPLLLSAILESKDEMVMMRPFLVTDFFLDTVPFRSIRPSRVTSRVVLDEIGCCPASHEEVVGFEKPLANWSKKTPIFSSPAGAYVL